LDWTAHGLVSSRRVVNSQIAVLADADTNCKWVLLKEDEADDWAAWAPLGSN